MTDRDLTPAVTDADQKVARALLRSLAACAMAGIEEDVAAQTIARARADADEAGYSRGLREGAASERERCIADLRASVEPCDERDQRCGCYRCEFAWEVQAIEDAIRARSEGGKV